jgi:hypothetical protein
MGLQFSPFGIKNNANEVLKITAVQFFTQNSDRDSKP